MKPSALIISSLIMALSVVPSFADVSSPISPFAKFHGLSSGRIIYKWEVDINHDERKVLLLAAKLTPKELAEEERENGWNPQIKNEIDFDVYIPQGNSHVRSKGIAEDNGIANGAVVSVDTTHCYAGHIEQLKKWGLVTVDHEPVGRNNSASNTVYAYTLEGDHLRRTILAQYDPTAKRGNAIYDQYLSDAHRTPLNLQEITLPRENS